MQEKKRRFREFRKVNGEKLNNVEYDDIVDCDGAIKAMCGGSVAYNKSQWDWCTAEDTYNCNLVKDVNPGGDFPAYTGNLQQNFNDSATQCGVWDRASKNNCIDKDTGEYTCMPNNTTMNISCKPLKIDRTNNGSNIFSLPTSY